MFGSGSPGGWATGGEFLRRGFRFTDGHVVPDEAAIPHAERWYAFSFGVALYDVDESLLTSAGLEPSRSRPTIGLGEAAPGRI